MKFDEIQLQKVAHKYNIRWIAAFGSQATGKLHTESDTDIAFEAYKVLDSKTHLQFFSELSDIFTNLDLVDINTASTLLKAVIAKEGKVLFENNSSVFNYFQLAAINEYIEYKPILDQKRSILLQKLKNVSA